MGAGLEVVEEREQAVRWSVAAWGGAGLLDAGEGLRSRVQDTMNAVTLAASKPLTAPAPPIPARNAFDCME